MQFNSIVRFLLNYIVLIKKLIYLLKLEAEILIFKVLF